MPTGAPAAPPAPAPKEGTPAPRGAALRALAVAVGIVVLVAGLRLAEPVLVPLVVGLFLAVLARPLHAGLRERLPRRLRWLALVVALLAILAGLLAFLGVLGWTARSIVDDIRERGPQLERQLGELRAAAERLGLPPGASGESSEGGVASFAAAAARTIASWTAGMLAGLALALGFAALGLAEVGEARRRIGRVRGGGRMLAAADEAAPAFRRYVWVKTLTSAITGIATALASLALGLPLWWVWGVIAFLFEYVPTIGSVLAVIPPVLVALADGGPERALPTLLVIGSVQVTLGNVVDPRIEGRFMDVSPFGVLLSIVFWGWLWGAAGALLAVPLTVALVVASRHVPGCHGLATIVAGDGARDGDDR